MTTPQPQRRDPQVIDIRPASGGIEYTWPITITETTPHDISTDTIQMCLGTDTTPGTWVTPDLDVTGQDQCGADAGVLNQRTVQLLIGDTYKPPATTYYVYTAIGDQSERVVRRHFRVTVIA